MPETNTIVIVFAIYLISLYFLSSLKPVYISFRKVYLFRCLFPSWKFYEDLSYIPVLYYRTSADGGNFGQWNLAVEKLERRWSRLFVNPEGNLCHAYNSLLHQLETDKEDIAEENKDDLLRSVSYQLTQNLVISKMKHEKVVKPFYQFKLSLEFQGNPEDCEDILYSITHHI